MKLFFARIFVRSVLQGTALFFLSLPGISCVSGENSRSDALTGETADGKYYISNGKVRLGVDRERGGSIFYFAEQSGDNLLNHADEGRFIQQSYYGEPDSSDWHGKPWVWNPIQGGGCRGEKARILSFEMNGDSLKIVSEPVHWASGKPVSEAQMEEVITLRGDMARIRYTFRYTGDKAKDHPAAHQEMPAVFVDADLPNMVFYGGDKPWTGDSLTWVVPGWPNQERIRTEEWAAYTDSIGYGIGVYTPGTPLATSYRFVGSGTTGPQGGDCSYFAPVRTFAVKKDMVLEYDVYLYIGTLDRMRAAFDAVRRETLHTNQ